MLIKRVMIILVTLVLLLVSAYVYTQTVLEPSNDWSPPIPWRADPANPIPGNEQVTIQTGSGVDIEVRITVDSLSTSANITNCGGTTRLGPSSSAICYSDDPTNPITISSDDLSKPAVGTYQIRTY